jgi:hypothetical protein
VGEDRLPIALRHLPGSTAVQHLYGGAWQGNGAGCTGLGHRLTVQSSYEYLIGGGIAAWLDEGGGHAHARDVGVQVEVGPLQGQRLTDAHPRAQQHKHHIVQVGRSPGATQHQAPLVASNTVLMGSRQTKQVAGLLD